MEEGKSDNANTVTAREVCTVLAIDYTDMFYRACSVCERTLPNSTLLCTFCVSNPPPPSKRFFRVMISIATDTEVINVVCFDRVARVLFGCSADHFFDFAKLHPRSGVTAFRILEGEMFAMSLSKPKNGNAQNKRVTSAVPLSSQFRPVIEVLRECYRSPPGS